MLYSRFIYVIIFLFVFPPVWQLALYISPTFFPFPLPSFPYPLSLPSLPPELPPMRMWPQPLSPICCIAFARGHRKTAENLCWYSRPFNRVCLQSNSLWKMTSRSSAFRCAGRGPTVTHPSTDPAKSCLIWVIAWHRTPTTHRTQSVI